MRRVVQALLVLIAAAARADAQEAAAAEPDAREVARLVAALGAPARAERIAAQRALLALPDDSAPLLERAIPPPGFEPMAALEYVRRHRRRAPRPIRVPAGVYQVGSTAPVDRNPPRRVELARFDIDDVEVTCFEWWCFVEATQAPPPPDWPGGRYRYGCESVPVVNVDPDEARRFASWVGGRLPTADEWEVAAHGGSPRPFPWGDEFEGHLAGTSLRRLVSGVSPPEVGSEREDRAPFGGFDFCSSVMEWVTLADGRVAARGGSFVAGTKEALRLTRAPDPQLTRRRGNIGLRVAERRR